MLGLQTSVDVATTATDTLPAQEKTLSIMDMIVDGGTANIVIIGILFVMLAVALFLYFERLFAIKAASKVDKTFMKYVIVSLLDGWMQPKCFVCNLIPLWHDLLRKVSLV